MLDWFGASCELVERLNKEIKPVLDSVLVTPLLFFSFASPPREVNSVRRFASCGYARLASGTQVFDLGTRTATCGREDPAAIGHVRYAD